MLSWRTLMRFQYSLMLALLFLVSSCKNSCPVGLYAGDNIAYFDLEVSISLANLEDLGQPLEIGGAAFCLSGTGKDATVHYNPEGQTLKQPCFQLAPGQVFQYPDSYFYNLYRPIDPDQFLFYYNSIPKDLNKFLVIRAHQHNKIRENLGFKYTPFTSGSALWSNQVGYNLGWSHPPEDASIFSFYGVLHSFLMTEEDSFIYIYLPLNLGIKTHEYAGVIPSKADYKTEANNFANPAFKLTPSFNQTLAFQDSYITNMFDAGCNAYDKHALRINITPEKLRPALSAYQVLVENYLKSHTAAFPNPYAKP